MNKNSETIKELSDCRNLLDKYIIDLGVLSAQYFPKKDAKLVPLINHKVEAIQKLELHIKYLENKLNGA
jgi:hypothetical protein